MSKLCNMFQDDGQDEYMVQQKISYRMYEQEQKVLLRSRYPFLSPVQISRKVRDSWNRLKQEAKQFYTKSVLVKTPTKDLPTKVTPKHKRQKVRGRLDVKEEGICDQTGCENDSVELPYQMSLFTSPIEGGLQNDSAYKSDFYSSPVVSPNTNACIRHDTSAPKMFESPHSESSPHQKFDMFTQQNYTKSKLPLKAPRIIQDEHSTQGILKGCRTDDTPRTKTKGRVSFSTDRNENFQQSQDYSDMDDNQDDDSEDEYNAMLIRRADDSYNFDDIDNHSMIVEEDRQGEIICNRNRDFIETKKTGDREMLKFDTDLDKRQKKLAPKKRDEHLEKTQPRKERLKETVEEKNLLKPTNSGNITKEKKKKEVTGNCSEKVSKKIPVNHDEVKRKKEKLPNGVKGGRQGYSDLKKDSENPSHYRLHENNHLNDSLNSNSQSIDSVNRNSQSNSNSSSQSESIASDKGQVLHRGSVLDMRSPLLESRKTRSSVRTKQNRKEAEVQSLSEARSGLKPNSVTMTTRDYDLTPVQREETKYITPQMDESIHIHNLREASKIPRKARRSSCHEENMGTKLPDNNLDRTSKLQKQKRRSSRRLAEEEEAYTEVKHSQDPDRFMNSGREDQNVLSPFVDASGDAKVSESPSDQRKPLRSKTKPVVQQIAGSPRDQTRSLKSKTKQLDIQPYKGKHYNPANYCDNDEDILKLSDHSEADSWTIMDEEYNSEAVSQDENDTHPSAQSEASMALVQALHKMKQVMADEDTSDERSSPKLLSPALSGISQMSSMSSDSSATNSQSTSGGEPSTQALVETTDKKTVTKGLCEMFGDMTPPQKRTSHHTRRLLASSSRATGSNFGQLFKSQNIFL